MTRSDRTPLLTVLSAAAALCLAAHLPSAAARVPAEPDAVIPAPGKVTLLEVSSVWCVPCRAMKPRMENLSRRFDDTGRAKIYIVEMDNDPGVIDRFQVTVTPELILFDRNGREVMRKKGLTEEAELAGAIEALL